MHLTTSEISTKLGYYMYYSNLFFFRIPTDNNIKVFHDKLPQNVPWHTAGVQYVVEASGMFTNLEKASVSITKVLIYCHSEYY